MSKCLGCGIKLQNIDSNIEGYVENINNNICERCFKLKNYGEYKITNKTNEDYLNILKNIGNNSLVIYVASILDLNIDYLNLFKNVILVITKKDLLPKSIKDNKIKNYFNNFNLLDIEVISSIKNYNLDSLYNKIINNKKNNKVYFVGNTNSGKSTLINKIIKNYSDNTSDITTSMYPSTTLNEIEINVNDELVIIDTPGIVDNNNLINNISLKEIKKITPKKEIKPRTYQVKGKGSLIVDNYLRFDYNTKVDNSFTIYIANNINITRVGEKNNKLMNKDKISFNLKNNKDIVIEGLCFIKFVKEIDVDIYMDKNIKVYERDNFI